MKTTKKLIASAASVTSGLLMGWSPSCASGATINTSSVQSGDWNTPATWSNGVPTSTSTPVTITAGTVVTASAVTLAASGVIDYSIQGELDLVNSSLTNLRRINNGGAGGFLSLSNSTFAASSGEGNAMGVYVGAGSSFTAATLTSGSNTTIASGGLATITSTTNPINGANVYINGGTFNTPALTGAPNVNLNGGKLVDTTIDATDSRAMSTWTGGEFVDNGGQWASNNATTFFGKLANDSTNVLTLSNTGKRTFTATSNAGVYSISAGTVQLSVYSNQANDNDKFGRASTISSTDYRISSAVHFKILGDGLQGDPSSYVGVVYLLVDDTTAGAAATMAPTLDAAAWNISGKLYNIGLTSSVDSATGSFSVTVASVTLAPEPGSLTLTSAAVAGITFRRRVRKRSRVR